MTTTTMMVSKPETQQHTGQGQWLQKVLIGLHCLMRPALFLTEPPTDTTLSHLESTLTLLDIDRVLRTQSVYDLLISIAAGQRNLSPDRSGDAARSFGKRV